MLLGLFNRNTHFVCTFIYNLTCNYSWQINAFNVIQYKKSHDRSLYESSKYLDVHKLVTSLADSVGGQQYMRIITSMI